MENGDCRVNSYHDYRSPDHVTVAQEMKSRDGLASTVEPNDSSPGSNQPAIIVGDGEELSGENLVIGSRGTTFRVSTTSGNPMTENFSRMQHPTEQDDTQVEFEMEQERMTMEAV